MKKFIHLASVSSRGHPRISLKIRTSLSHNGYDVSLFVADGLGTEEYNGAIIYDVGQSRGRVDCILRTSILVYKEAILEFCETRLGMPFQAPLMNGWIDRVVR